jgi:ferritin-like metal-binding protein YciE
MPIQSPKDLLLYQLQAIQDSEQQASQALQHLMTQATENTKLRPMVERRLQQGERILQEVQKGLEKLGGQAPGFQSAAVRGLIQEAEMLLKEAQTPEMKQAVVIGGLRKLEHYCIGLWDSVKTLARQAGEQDLAQAMERAVKEGYEWDRELAGLAEGQISSAT